MIKAKLASLTGNVTNALDGSPIANATVIIAGLTTTTNSNGAYVLKDIKPGYVNADFSSNTQKIKLRAILKNGTIRDSSVSQF